jgi:hypothetical protein
VFHWRQLVARVIALLCLSTGLLTQPVIAADAPPQSPPPSDSATNAPLRKVSEHVFEIGLVRLDKTTRTVTFPASVNMEEGLVEYFLVCSNGKIHESVLITEAEPYHIHVAMLLLGAKGAPPLTPEARVAEQQVQGEPFRIHVLWQQHGEAKRLPAERLVFQTADQKPMTDGPWTYNGSWVFEGTFLAQRERSIVAIITDHDALVNNPRPGHENDELWLVNKQAIPPMGTKMTVTFELPPVKKESKAE